MSGKFSLKDHLFNAVSLGQLAEEYAAGVPGFDPARFLDEVLPVLSDHELLARLEVISDGIERQLSADFPTLADQLEASMPARLDPSKTDDDFGHFIHAVPGILAVRHGIEGHRDRALDLLLAATQRFSMEFYIRAFINRWPEETLARLALWARHDNYHVRRLVSEGTRPKLPWAKAITLDPMVPLAFLDQLHADPTRYVTRSVANHLNDIAKINPDAVIDILSRWRDAGRQRPEEFAWMTRHALRTLIKQGHAGAMAHLGYRADLPVTAQISVDTQDITRGEPLRFSVKLSATEHAPILVDYLIWFRKSDGGLAPKVFKLKQAELQPGKAVNLKKVHKLKWDATTFRLFPGAHRLGVQVNGRIVAEADFTLLA